MIKDKKTNIEEQIVQRGITNKKIIDAFMRVPRENFVLEEYKPHAYVDYALPIKCSQTISQPYIVALMTQMLDVKEEHRVLEIGTGSGYQAAILSNLAKEVISYEIIGELVEIAKNNLRKSNMDNVKVIHVDGSEYFNKNYKNYFDRVIVTSATNKICDNWNKYLKEEGILIMPFGEKDFQILKKYKKLNGELKLINESIAVRFVPLTGKKGI